LRRFEQEAFAASALNHPNILTIYEFGAEKNVHFLAAEFIEGEILGERLQREQLTVDEALDVAVQTVSALAAAHETGIIHRDIKPENIMIRRDRLVKVLDFGLAKLTEKESYAIESEAETRSQIRTAPGVIMGTAAYMLPEQARGKQTDARSDIWSFGVVLYEMLARRQPFQGETINDTIAAVLTKQPAPPTNFNRQIPAELEHIVLKTLASANKSSAERSENGTQILSAQTTSGVKYIVGKIKNHKVGFVVLSGLLLALVGFSYWFFINRSANTSPIESIAIPPFVNETGNADNEYLSDGMTESLINSLSQLPKLSVKARSSVFRYKGKDVSPQTVGNELSVQAVLLGRVVQRGEQLTLYLELIDAQTGNRIWGEQYNRKNTDLVSLQSEIARDVSNKLRVKLMSVDKQNLVKNYTENAEAYQLYLKGKFLQRKVTPQDSHKAIEYFQQAIILDPNYALAYVGLADAYSDWNDLPPREFMPKTRELTLKALSLDDQLPDAHVLLGDILFQYDYDFVGAEHEFKIAVELNPNDSDAHQAYGRLLMYLGRSEESFAELRRALELDPISPSANRRYGEGLFIARRYDEAIAHSKKNLELDANYFPTHYILALAYEMKGNYAESAAERVKINELVGTKQNAEFIQKSFAQDGWRGLLLALTDDWRPIGFPPCIVATFHAELGEKDKAFALLNKLYEDRDSDLVMLKVDPRFQDLLRRVNFPQ
jgi:eukaryotic-like serine/threonine-protein kinase